MKYSDTLLRYRGFQVADLVTDEQQQEVAQCKESVCECRRHKRCGFNPCVWKIPRRRKWQPAPVFLPRKSPGQRSLAGYCPWGHTRVRHSWAAEHALCLCPQCHLFLISFQSTFLTRLGAEWCCLLVGVEYALWVSLLGCSGIPDPWHLSLCQSLSLSPGRLSVPFQLSLCGSNWPHGAFKPNNCLYSDSLTV